MVYHLSLYSTEINEEDDLESIFSLEDEQSPETLQIIDYSDSEDDTAKENSQELLFSIPEINVINPAVPNLSLLLDRPYAKINIFLDHYAKPITVIAFFDTGAACTIINPEILPPSHWKLYYQVFHAANGQPLVVDYISKPIHIQLFHGCVIQHKVLGSGLPEKDLMIGFYIIHKLPNVKWTKHGLVYKNFKLP